MTPLYGHTSEATAYLVADYPYGFTTRTQIRYWLEHKNNKGVRFVSQTLNPKTGRWNKPKASTYADIAAAMYLDEEGHVQWAQVTSYTDAAKVADFVRKFPEACPSAVRAWVAAKVKWYEKLVSGAARFVIAVNGTERVRGKSEIDADRARDQAELDAWSKVFE